jgi:hypothetical protein
MLNSQVNKKVNCYEEDFNDTFCKKPDQSGRALGGLYRVIRGVAVTNKIN